MDGDAVKSEEPSKETTPQNLTELFHKVFPYYMSIGMTYDEFWRGPVWLVKAYREAYILKTRHEEWARWRSGMYVYNALLCVAPVMRAALSKTPVEPGKYIDEPLPITEKEAKEREEARERANFFAYVKRMEEESEKVLKKRQETKALEVNVDGGY